MWRITAIAVITALWLSAILQAEPTQKTEAEKPSSSSPTQSSVLPTPLPAAQFQGRVRTAYQAAADIPQVLAEVTCYCGCDKSQGHRNLLDCFVDTHGAT